MLKVVLVYVVALGISAISAADSDVTDFPDSLHNRTDGVITTLRTKETTTKYIEENDESVKEFEISTNTDESSLGISTTKLFPSATKSPNRGKESRSRNGRKRNKKRNSRNKNKRNDSSVTESHRESKTIVFAEEEGNNEKAEKISNDPENEYNTDDVTAFSRGRSDSNNDGSIDDTSEVVCSSPPEIEGSISPVLHGTEHPEGTTIWYQCPIGHVSRSSSSLLATCRLNPRTGKGEWTQPDISCIPRSCGDPGYVPNGRRIGNLLTFPNKVEFECQEGFKLRGIKSRYCQAGGEWSGKLPTCEPIYCPAPSDPANGRVLFSSLEYGSELEYKCNEGYMMRNHQTRYCTKDGQWSGADPECEEITCEMPEKPLHGSVRLSGELKPGSLALFSCDQGTTLVGTSRNKCLPSGSWTFDPPKCLRFCKAPYIENGEIGSFEEVRTNRKTTYLRFVRIHTDEQVENNKTVVLRCREGFLPGNHTADETDEVMCIDGTWSKTMQCQEFLCSGEPPPVEHGSTRLSSRKHKATVWYKCDGGYGKAKSGNITCMYGNWIGTTPVCADYRCYLNQLSYPGLVKPAGEFLYDTHGIDIQCEESYKTNSWKRRILCSRGKWDIDRNPCSIRVCEDDPPIPNKGKPKEYTRHHGSVVDYECDANFEISGQSSVHCELGKWVGQPPACMQILQLVRNTTASSKFGSTGGTTREPLSGTPMSERLDDCTCTYHYREDLLYGYVGNRRLTGEKKVKKGETVAFSCRQNAMDIVWPIGFRMQGTLYLTCSTCQVWEMHDLPYCENRQSGDAFITYASSMKFLPGGILDVKKLEKVRLICNSPWGQPKWNDGQRTGIKYFQSTAESNLRTGIFASYMIIEEMKEEHSGIYQCIVQDFYGTVYRPATVNLQIAAPEIQCSDLRADTDRGRFIIEYQNERRVNSTARYECADSFQYVLGENVRKCLGSGKWSGTYPHCTDIRCPQLDEKDMSITYTDDRKINSEAVFTCKSTTQRLIGTKRRTCLSSGLWSGQDPSCEDITCSEFPRYNRLSISYTNGLKVNSIANFTCEPPAELVGSSSSLCQHDGKWSEPKPSCELLEIHCPKIEGGEIFSIKYSDNTTRRINSTATLFCKADFQKIEGCNILTCQPNGEWSGELPTCVDYVVCEEFESLPYLEVSYSDGVRVGSIASFRCSDGTTLQGPFRAECRYDGKWTYQSPTCKAASCSIDNLMELLPEGVYPDVGEATSDTVDSSSELRLECENLPRRQLILTGNSKAVCSNGKWEFGNVQCVPGCRLKVDTSPYLIIEPKEDHYRFGESVTLSCVDDYKLTSDIQKVMCLGGTWSHDFPDCIENTETTPTELTKVTKKSK